MPTVVERKKRSTRDGRPQAERPSLPDRRVQRLLECTGAVPWEADATTWQFTYVGPQAARLLGYPAEAWYTQDFWIEHLHPDDRESALSFCLERSKCSTDYDFQYRMVAKDGRHVWIHDVVHVESVDGVPKTLTGFMIDITTQKAAEAGARANAAGRKQAELKAQERFLQLAHAGRISTLGQLTASIAHEIKQPLTAILSNAQAAERFLSQEPPNLQELGDILADIVKDDRRAAEVIRRLRTLLGNEPQVETEVLNLNQVVAEVLPLMSSDAIIKRVTITTKFDPFLPSVRGDRIQLQQVILNLLMNGVEAMTHCHPDDRTIVLRTARDTSKNVVLSVQDCGVGVTEENLEQLFTPFYSTKASGMGMGLSIARSIVELYDGRLWVTQNPDRGATFLFSLPVIQREDT